MSSSLFWSIRRDLGSLAVYTPAAGVALVIAENFYKFHSFTLECLAFLGTMTGVHVIGRAVLAAIWEVRRRWRQGSPYASS